MDLGLALEIIDKISSEKVSNSVCWLQLHVLGEPMMHPHLFQIIKYAEGKKVPIYLNTNGSFLTPDNLKKLWDSKLTCLVISYQTPDERRFQHRNSKEMGFTTYREMIFNALEDKIKNNTKTRINLHLLNTKQHQPNGVCVIDDNQEAKEIFYDLLKFSNGLKKKYQLNFNWRPLSSEVNLDRLLDGPEDVLEFLPGVNLVLKRAGSWESAYNGNRKLIKTACNTPFEQLVIYWDGECGLCCIDYDNEIKIGNIKGKTISEIWLGEKAKKIRSGFIKGKAINSRCKRCLA